MKLNPNALDAPMSDVRPHPIPAEPTTRDRIARAHRSFNTRRLPSRELVDLTGPDERPAIGDVVLARVAEIGQHTRLQLTTGRRATLHPGDEILVCYGARYAPNQFEAYVPDDLGRCHLVAAGGIAGEVETQHRSMRKPTVIEPIGLVVDGSGTRVNLRDYTLDARADWSPMLAIAVVGTSMDSGKTTTAAALIRGLRRSGLRVGAAKLTGTGAGGDYWQFRDSGASPVWDFVDAGYPTTYRIGQEALLDAADVLTSNLSQQELDVMVLEVADGVLQPETRALLTSGVFRNRVTRLLLAATDAMGADSGVRMLTECGVAVSAISGALTQSRLAAREAEQATGLTTLSVGQLEQAGIGARLLELDRAPHR
ncbi:MAG: DUF1611 domain-containing protein [Planctomycetota bacterium]